MDTFKGARKILIGSSQINEIFRKYKRIFIVCDPYMVESQKTTYLTDRLNELRAEYYIYSNIKPDPGVNIVADGIASLIEFNPDVVVSFGGGSAIDACKAMIYFAAREKMIENIPHIAIPTTSGTGSEVTDFSVISDDENGIKYPIVEETLLPDIAILDAELTISVSPSVTAIAGIDVVTHAIEAIASKNSNDFSDAAAEKSIKLARANLLKTYKEPKNLEARQAMHNASCLAGIAFNNAGLGLNHGMAHALGGKFHLPHGMANAILLPYVMGFNAGCFDNLTEHAHEYARIARLIHVDSSSVRQSALNLIRAVKKLIKNLDLPATIREAGVEEDAFLDVLDELASTAFKDKCTATNPRLCSISDIRNIYTHAYYGRIRK